MHFYIVIEDCYNRIYSWPWISSIKRNEAIPAFLLLFFLIIEFSLSSYSSSTCANLSMYLLRCEGNAATSLPRNPTVQSSVPSLMRTALIVSNGLPNTSSTTASLNLITSSALTAFPQHSCCSHERPLLEAFSPSNSPSRRLLIVADLVVDMINM